MTPSPSSAATSTSGFKTRLKARIAATGTSLCVGVDPHLHALPPFFARELERQGPTAFIAELAAALIEAAAGVVPAIKFQSAFFEAHGADGFRVLQNQLAWAKERGLLTILDAKRGDIASTMAAYGEMAFGAMEADCLTVTPYMGLDVTAPLQPWLAAGRGVFVVWVSSNPGGALVQDAVAGKILDAFEPDFQRRGMADALGLVLGATRVDTLAPDMLERLRHVALLMPGIGAQGGVVTPRVQQLMRDSGAVLVPQSRSLSSCPTEVASWDDYRALVSARVRQAAAELAC